MIIAACFVGFTGLSVALMPLFMRHVINVAIPHKDFRLALLTMSLFVALMVLRMAAWYAGQSILLLVREKIIFHLRSAVFTRLQHLCLRFHQRYSPGYLFDRTLGNASTAVGTFLSMLFNTLVTQAVILLVSLGICFYMHPGLATVILVMSCGYVLIGRFFRAKIHALTSAFNRMNNEFAGLVTDRLRGVMTIKAFAMEQRVITEFDEELWPLQLRSLDLNKQTMLLGFNVEGLGYLINAVIVVGASYLVMTGQFPPSTPTDTGLGTMVAFISYQATITGMLGALATISGTYGAAMAGLEQLYEVLDERPSVVEKPGAVMPQDVQGSIIFDGVKMAFDQKKVFHGLSCRVAPGQSVALVGPSGGGKTTLINLLLRFYDPDAGQILLDGHPITDLPLAGYRGLFGVVLQDPFLFNASIYENMRAVKPEATDEEIRSALERAQAWEFVSSQRGGWHYKVGEGGSRLSGGQRQRIALARCFLTDPRIMILDEATSALDNQSEFLIQQALQEIMQGRNVFVIAHRLSTVRHVDRILVLQDGQIVQDGTYDELYNAPGLFRDLHMAASDSMDLERS